jgi:cytochrome c5
LSVQTTGGEKEKSVSPKVRVLLPKLNMREWDGSSSGSSSAANTGADKATKAAVTTAADGADDGQKVYKYFCMDCEGIGTRYLGI